MMMMMIMTMTWWWSRDDDEMVQHWKNCFVDTYTNKLYLSFFESRWTHIHCLVLRSKTNNSQLIKLAESATYSVHSDKNKEKMTHWTRYCATASFVYHSGKPILTLNLSPSRQSEVLLAVLSNLSTNALARQTAPYHPASVPNIFYFTWLCRGGDGVCFKQNCVCKAVFVGHQDISIIFQFWQNTLTSKSLDKILWCCHSNKGSSAVLSHGTIYLVCNSNFWVCGPNPMVLPFKWNLFSSTFTWYCLFGMCSSNT